jgi:hypothetical protein
LFFSPIAAALLIISLPLLIWYLIPRKSHAELMKKVKASAA